MRACVYKIHVINALMRVDKISVDFCHCCNCIESSCVCIDASSVIVVLIGWLYCLVSLAGSIGCFFGWYHRLM